MKKLKVCIVGAPNVGKSTLINHIVGDKICIVSPKPHTTQESTLAVCNIKDCQLIFTDTPGFSASKKQNLIILNKKVIEALPNNDLVILMIDATKKLQNSNLITACAEIKNLIIIINKIDLVNKGVLLPLTDQLKTITPNIFYISALNGDGIDKILQLMINRSICSDWLYEADFITNRSYNDQIKDRIMEVLLTHLDKEVPYHTNITIDSYKENKREAILHCSLHTRQAHRHIILSKIKTISVDLRRRMEDWLRKTVHSFVQWHAY